MQYLIAFIAGLVGVLAGVWIGGGSGDSGDSGPAPQTTPATLTILSTAEQDALNLPFAEGTRVGDVIYLSGQIGARPGSMSLVEGGIKAETRQALENIQATLQRHGSDLDQVFKCTVFLLDMAEWPMMNEVYTEIFAGHRPARSAFAAAGLALDGRIEIECMALAKTAG